MDNELKNASELRLRSLLLRAHNSLCEGFIGGEWANSVPDRICAAASKEHFEAENLINEIHKELALDT
jgi:hypothetical protein